MIKKEKNINSRIRQILSYLVMSVFLFTTFIQVLHNHDASQDELVAHTEHPTFSKLVHSCELCDFHHQHEGKILHSVSHVQIPEPAIIELNKNTGTIAINYSFTLQGFTNKGPPTFSC